MNIIQSFYQIDNNTCYNNKVNKNNDNYLINYYSMLLSFITLKKLYGNVTIYCNDFAYEKLIRHIPYDNVIKNEIDFINVNNYQNEWGLLKFNVFEQQKKPFIHVDCDVFMFEDLFSDYINDDEYDAVVQSIDIDNEYNIYNDFYKNNKKKLNDLGFIKIRQSEESYRKYKTALGYNNGVVGFKNLKMMEDYIDMSKKMNNLMNEKVFRNVKHQTMIFEQFNLYHFSLMNNYNVNTILPTNDYIELGGNAVGNKYKYTHLLSGNKYVDRFVMLVRDKIIKDYFEYVEYLFSFEKTMLDKKIKFNIHKNINKFIE